MVQDDDAAWHAFCEELTTVVNKCRLAFGSEANVRLVKGRNFPVGAISINSSVLLKLTPGSGWTNNASPLRCRVRMRIDVHTETYTVTLSADQIEATSECPLNEQVHSAWTGGMVPTEMPLFLEKVFDSLWNDTNSPFGQCAEYILDTKGGARGSLFADFRGVILPSPAWDPKSESGKPISALASPKPTALDAAKSGVQAFEDRLEQIGDHRRLHPRLEVFWAKYRDSVTAFVKGALPISPSNESGSEWVICSMLDGNAIYASPLVQWGVQVQPVRYLVVLGSDVDPDQAGRFVRRLHVLGELRHAALMDYETSKSDSSGRPRGLKSASKALRGLGRTLDKKIEIDGDIGIDDLKKLNKALTELNSFADGGITYRVEQSRYYTSAFKERLVDLRVGRIEGYQPYDAFVRRYLYALFNKIDQIGRRYEALSRRVDRWTFLADAASSDKFYGAIGDNTGKLVGIAEQLSELQKSTKSLLENAEKFATVFAVYYVGAVLSDWLLEGAAEDSKSIVYGIWAAVMILVVADVIANENKNQISRKVFDIVRAAAALIFQISRELVAFVRRVFDRAQSRE
jgi:uncharacterized membrane-anchored protein